MALAAVKKENTKYTELIESTAFTEESISCAKHYFNEFRDKGILYDCEFQQQLWHTTNQHQHVGIRFDVSETAYTKFYANILGIPYCKFIEYMKTYLVFHMGELVLTSLQITMNDIKKLILSNPESISSNPRSIKAPLRVSDFLASIPIEDKNVQQLEAIIEQLEFLVSESPDRFRRELPTYDSIFLFNDILDDFWKYEKDVNLKIFYAPVYLWWHITMIVPTRPKELLLTPRDCLLKVPKKHPKPSGPECDYYLILRKNNIKGPNKPVSYTIENDFFKFKTGISYDLGKTIEEYIKLTSSFASTDINTLFIQDPHYHHWNQNRPVNSRYFTYCNFSTLLRCFFQEIIVNRYGLTIVEKGERDHLNEGEINRIYLGDTRHFAMINAIMDGGTPVIAMQLAGQTEIGTASHYYTNIEQYVKCKTFRKYRNVLGGKVTYSIQPPNQLPAQIPYTQLDTGARCYSKNYSNGVFQDCLAAIGPGGEIAYCPSCKHYRKGKSFLSADDASRFRKNITDSLTYLKDMMSLFRQGRGDSEGLMRAYQRFQDDVLSYRQYCEEKSKQEERETLIDGQEEKDYR